MCEQCQTAIEDINQLVAALKTMAEIERSKVIDIDILRRARALRTRFALGASGDVVL